MVAGGSSYNRGVIMRSDYYSADSLANSGNYFDISSNGVITAKVACKVWIIRQNQVWKNEIVTVSAGEVLGNYYAGSLGISQLFLAIR